MRQVIIFEWYSLMLNVTDKLPDGILDLDATRLHEVLAGPTLFHLPGKLTPALFVSVLLHGNEDTGWEAVRRLLTRYVDSELPRALSLFIGNVEAAREGMRRLDGQQDFNRIWLPGSSPEHHMTRQVLDEMRNRGVFASIDIHNNTGLNPHYACINRLEDPFFHLATLFNRTVVYFVKPEGVQSAAFADLCPAVTLECGQVGQRRGIDHAVELIDACIHLHELPGRAVAAHDIDLYHTVAIAKVPEQISFGFNDDAADICFVSDIDHMNFRELPANTVLGSVGEGEYICLDVRNEHGEQVCDQYFDFSNGRISTRQPVMPSMLTLDARIIRQDCLCYLMERFELPDAETISSEDGTTGDQ